MKILKSGGKLHWVKNLYLRYRYGAGCCDTYNLDTYLARKILPALKEFRKHKAGYPVEFSSFEEWDKAMGEMIWAFEYFLEGKEACMNMKQENWIDIALTDAERETRGFELFGKYFRSLWY